MLQMFVRWWRSWNLKEKVFFGKPPIQEASCQLVSNETSLLWKEYHLNWYLFGKTLCRNKHSTGISETTLWKENPLKATTTLASKPGLTLRLESWCHYKHAFAVSEAPASLAAIVFNTTSIIFQLFIISCMHVSHSLLAVMSVGERSGFVGSMVALLVFYSFLNLISNCFFVLTSCCQICFGVVACIRYDYGAVHLAKTQPLLGEAFGFLCLP